MQTRRGLVPVLGGLAAFAGAITAGVLLTDHSSPPPPNPPVSP